MDTTRRTFLGMAAATTAALGARKTERAAGPRFFVATLTAMDRAGRFDEALNRDLLAFLR
jgi:hypothetical protein